MVCALDESKTARLRLFGVIFPSAQALKEDEGAWFLG